MPSVLWEHYTAKRDLTPFLFFPFAVYQNHLLSTVLRIELYCAFMNENRNGGKNRSRNGNDVGMAVAHRDPIIALHEVILELIRMPEYGCVPGLLQREYDVVVKLWLDAEATTTPSLTLPPIRPTGPADSTKAEKGRRRRQDHQSSPPIGAVQTLLASAACTASQTATLVQEAVVLRSMLREQSKQIDDLKTQCTSLRQELATKCLALDECQQALQQLKAASVELKHEKDTANTETARLRKELVKLQILERQNSGLPPRSGPEAAHRTFNSNNENGDELSQLYKHMQAEERRARALERDLQTLTLDRDDVHAQYLQAINDNETLQAEVKEKEQEATTLHDEYTRQVQENRTLRALVNELHALAGRSTIADQWMSQHDSWRCFFKLLLDQRRFLTIPSISLSKESFAPFFARIRLDNIAQFSRPNAVRELPPTDGSLLSAIMAYREPIHSPSLVNPPAPDLQEPALPVVVYQLPKEIRNARIAPNDLRLLLAGLWNCRIQQYVVDKLPEYFGPSDVASHITEVNFAKFVAWYLNDKFPSLYDRSNSTKASIHAELLPKGKDARQAKKRNGKPGKRGEALEQPSTESASILTTDLEPPALSCDALEVLYTLFYTAEAYQNADPEFRLFYLVATNAIPEKVAIDVFLNMQALYVACEQLCEDNQDLETRIHRSLHDSSPPRRRSVPHNADDHESSQHGNGVLSLSQFEQVLRNVLYRQYCRPHVCEAVGLLDSSGLHAPITPHELSRLKFCLSLDQPGASIKLPALFSCNLSGYPSFFYLELVGQYVERYVKFQKMVKSFAEKATVRASPSSSMHESDLTKDGSEVSIALFRRLWLKEEGSRGPQVKVVTNATKGLVDEALGVVLDSQLDEIGRYEKTDLLVPSCWAAVVPPLPPSAQQPPSQRPLAAPQKVEVSAACSASSTPSSTPSTLAISPALPTYCNREKLDGRLSLLYLFKADPQSEEQSDCIADEALQEASFVITHSFVTNVAEALEAIGTEYGKRKEALLHAATESDQTTVAKETHLGRTRTRSRARLLEDGPKPDAGGDSLAVRVCTLHVPLEITIYSHTKRALTLPPNLLPPCHFRQYARTLRKNSDVQGAKAYPSTSNLHGYRRQTSMLFATPAQSPQQPSLEVPATTNPVPQ